MELQTADFGRQCDNILTEQKRTAKVAADVEENLKYYSFLEPVTKRLNAPTAGALVKTQEFSNLLARLDECLNYMSSHVRTYFMLISYIIC